MQAVKRNPSTDWRDTWREWSVQLCIFSSHSRIICDRCIHSLHSRTGSANSANPILLPTAWSRVLRCWVLTSSSGVYHRGWCTIASTRPLQVASIRTRRLHCSASCSGETSTILAALSYRISIECKAIRFVSKYLGVETTNSWPLGEM